MFMAWGTVPLRAPPTIHSGRPRTAKPHVAVLGSGTSPNKWGTCNCARDTPSTPPPRTSPARPTVQAPTTHEAYHQHGKHTKDTTNHTTRQDFRADLALPKDTNQTVGSSTLRHSQSATLLLWGDLCRPFSFHIGSLEHAGSSAGRHQRSPGARSVPIWCGQVASPKKSIFLEEKLPQAAKLPATSGLSNKKTFFKKKFCPRQRSCPWQVVCSKKLFLRKSPAPGSEAAQDKWFVQQKVRFLRKNLSQAAKLPRTSGLFKKKFC